MSLLQRHDTGASSSAGKGKTLIQKMFSDGDQQAADVNGSLLLNSSQVLGMSAADVTPPSSAVDVDRKRLMSSSSSLAVQRVLEKSKSSSNVLGDPSASSPAIPRYAPSPAKSHVIGSASSPATLPRYVPSPAKSQDPVRREIPSSPGVLGTSPIASASPARMATVTVTPPAEQNLERSLLRDALAESPPSSSSSPQPLQQQRRIQSLSSAAPRLKSFSSSGEESQQRPRRESPMISHAKQSSPARRLPPRRYSSSTANNSSPFRGTNRIIQLAGGRDRGSPVPTTAVREQPSMMSSLDSSNITCGAGDVSSQVAGQESMASPIELSSRPSNLDASMLASPVDASETGSSRRRRQLVNRNNESRLELSNSFLLREKKRLDGDEAIISVSSAEFQSAFDVNPSPQRKRSLVSFPSNEPPVPPAAIQPLDSIKVVESPEDVGRRAGSPTKSRLSRSTKSAPTTLSADLPPRPIMSRYKAGKSPLKEALTTGGGGENSNHHKPSPSQMRDLFRKTIGEDVFPSQQRSAKRAASRKSKEERLQSFLDSPRELRALGLEDGGFLRPEYRKTAWPCLLADANRRVPHELSSEEQLAGEDVRHVRDHRQIDLDCERKYEEADVASRDRLRRFLHAFFQYHPELSYFQGFHDLCALVLKVFDDDLVADFVAYKISTNTIVRDAHRPTMDATFAELKAVFYILECADAELANKLRATVGVESFWGISMLTCLFAHDVAHGPTLERLLDSCLSSGPHFPLYLVASLALLPKTRQYLMQCERDETAFLGTLRQDARDIMPADADELVRFAQILERRVPPSRVVDFAYRKAGLPTDSFLATRWLVKSKWMFGAATFKLRDKPLGE